MSAMGRTGTGTAAAVETLESASFVHLLAHADGDSLAAAAVVARALDDDGRPFHLSVVRTAAEAERRVATTDADTTCCVVGVDAPAAAAVRGTPRSAAAATVATALGASPPATLSLAGVLAAGATPDALPDEATADVARHPGVGVPTADLADGLAHSTLVHAPYSGDASAASAALADLGVDATAAADGATGRRVASLLALDATTDAPAQAATAVTRALRPHRGGPLETVEGYADVLDLLARRAPGLATALALGHDVTDAARDAWRTAASAVHRAVREAEVARHSGVVVARVGDADVWTAARLLRDYRASEPAALAVGDGEAALATTDADAAAVAAETGADVTGTATRAVLCIDAEQTTEDGAVAAVRRAL